MYSESAVEDLLETLGQLSGPNTTIFLAGELRNGKEFAPFFTSFLDLNPYQSQFLTSRYCFLISDAILEYFIEAAMINFTIGRVDQTLWHPDYHSNRVVLYVLVKK